MCSGLISQRLFHPDKETAPGTAGPKRDQGLCGDTVSGTGQQGQQGTGEGTYHPSAVHSDRQRQ